MLISVGAFGCSCVTIPLLDRYQRSEFIATVKIFKVTQDNQNADYHDIEIEGIDVYKGNPISKLKVVSMLNTSCSFLPSENTTWLIFASKDHNGFLSFGSCSGSMQVDRQFDLVKYPNVDINYKKTLNLKLEALEFLKRNNISAVNQFNLRIANDVEPCKENLQNFNERNRFAVYELTVNQDLSIEDIRTIKGFDNKELSEKLTNCMREIIEIRTDNLDGIPNNTSIILMYFYYPAENKFPSFISVWDL